MFIQAYQLLTTISYSNLRTKSTNSTSIIPSIQYMFGFFNKAILFHIKYSFISNYPIY